MKNFIKSLFKKSNNETAKEFNIMNAQESFTITEVHSVISEWNNAIDSKQPIEKILIVNNKAFGSYRKGDVISVQKYSGENISGYKAVDVGGVFFVPTSENIQEVFEGNILYIPYFD